jgi:hypothetical protein
VDHSWSLASKASGGEDSRPWSAEVSPPFEFFRSESFMSRRCPPHPRGARRKQTAGLLARTTQDSSPAGSRPLWTGRPTLVATLLHEPGLIQRTRSPDRHENHGCERQRKSEVAQSIPNPGNCLRRRVRLVRLFSLFAARPRQSLPRTRCARCWHSTTLATLVCASRYAAKVHI